MSQTRKDMWNMRLWRRSTVLRQPGYNDMIEKLDGYSSNKSRFSLEKQLTMLPRA